MNQRMIIISVAILVLIVAGMFVFAYFKKQEMNTAQTPVSQTQSTVSSSSDPYASISIITAKHYFQDGVHTFAGEIPMPTPCDLVEATTTVLEAQSPQKVSIDFTVINNAQTCEQTVTNQRFKVSYTGADTTEFSARFMGRAVRFNSIPAGPGEKPEDFQLYQKG